MITYILRRVLLSIPLLWAVVTLVFVSVHLFPGDPVQVMLQGQSASAITYSELRHRLGLDQPLLLQYWTYLYNLVHLNLGRSIRSGTPIWSDILARWPTTVELALIAAVGAAVLGVLWGIAAALTSRTWLGAGIVGIAVLGISIPDFWLGTVLSLVLGLRLGWFPMSGLGDWRNLVMPALTLIIPIAAALSRIVRSSLLNVFSADFMRTARSKGLRESVVLFRHALINALIPVVTVFGLTFAGLLGGVVVIENVFGLPGLGTYAVSAVTARDFPVIQGTAIFFAVILILANLLVDLSYAILDPRIRFD